MIIHRWKKKQGQRAIREDLSSKTTHIGNNSSTNESTATSQKITLERNKYFLLKKKKRKSRTMRGSLLTLFLIGLLSCCLGVTSLTEPWRQNDLPIIRTRQTSSTSDDRVYHDSGGGGGRIERGGGDWLRSRLRERRNWLRHLETLRNDNNDIRQEQVRIGRSLPVATTTTKIKATTQQKRNRTRNQSPREQRRRCRIRNNCQGKNWCPDMDVANRAYLAPTVFEGKARSMSSLRKPGSNYAVTFEVRQVYKSQTGFLPLQKNDSVRLHFRDKIVPNKSTVCSSSSSSNSGNSVFNGAGGGGGGRAGGSSSAGGDSYDGNQKSGDFFGSNNNNNNNINYNNINNNI